MLATPTFVLLSGVPPRTQQPKSNLGSKNQENSSDFNCDELEEGGESQKNAALANRKAKKRKTVEEELILEQQRQDEDSIAESKCRVYQTLNPAKFMKLPLQPFCISLNNDRVITVTSKQSADIDVCRMQVKLRAHGDIHWNRLYEIALAVLCFNDGFWQCGLIAVLVNQDGTTTEILGEDCYTNKKKNKLEGMVLGCLPGEFICTSSCGGSPFVRLTACKLQESHRSKGHGRALLSILRFLCCTPAKKITDAAKNGIAESLSWKRNGYFFEGDLRETPGIKLSNEPGYLVCDLQQIVAKDVMKKGGFFEGMGLKDDALRGLVWECKTMSEALSSDSDSEENRTVSDIWADVAASGSTVSSSSSSSDSATPNDQLIAITGVAGVGSSSSSSFSSSSSSSSISVSGNNEDDEDGDSRKQFQAELNSEENSEVVKEFLDEFQNRREAQEERQVEQKKDQKKFAPEGWEGDEEEVSGEWLGTQDTENGVSPLKFPRVFVTLNVFCFIL